MVNKPKVPCDTRFWDTVHTTVSLVLGVDALHEFSVQMVKSETEQCKCGPGFIQSVVIEAVWTYRHVVRVGVGVQVGPLPLEVNVGELSNKIVSQQRGSQKHTFYCCDDNRREAELRRGPLRQ
jgi:hypothetical protein